MGMKKAELEKAHEELLKENEELKHEIRRMKRSILQDVQTPESKEIRVEEKSCAILPQVPELLKRAFKEWETVVAEPPQENSNRINYYIKSVDCLGWTFEDDYQRNGDFAWCGAFASFFWGPVKQKIRYHTFASCYRFQRDWGKTPRSIKKEQMLPGDIVTVKNPKNSKWYGDHIVICTHPPKDGKFKTIEGNAWGELGDGTRGEGVIVRERDLDSVAFCYRVLESDLDER